MTAARNETFPCPHCGEDVPVTANVCRACGASDESGWNDDDTSEYDPYDDDVDFGDSAAAEVRRESAAAGVPMWIRLVILAIVVSFVLSLGLW